ncbi:hypothetical protein FRAAL3178 [Frankia alni ACN14a]|uniref:Uncharacterized protein n=1 Tax=Frankia alni (strain DSM 45986 / CECT 9034 / ACN14a) TaxID=326424 RepID=Q0RKY3_FRAAA|nr:hypothetical protein FRAAL3178 [Frankia alni ACN14a]
MLSPVRLRPTERGAQRRQVLDGLRSRSSSVASPAKPGAAPLPGHAQHAQHARKFLLPDREGTGRPCGCRGAGDDGPAEVDGLAEVSDAPAEAAHEFPRPRSSPGRPTRRGSRLVSRRGSR